MYVYCILCKCVLVFLDMHMFRKVVCSLSSSQKRKMYIPLDTVVCSCLWWKCLKQKHENIRLENGLRLKVPSIVLLYIVINISTIMRLSFLWITLTRVPLGGGVWTPPVRFFVNNLKTAELRAAVFGIPYHTSFPHMLWKFQTQVTQRSGHQVTSSALTS